jgi:hypothetical protein
MDLCPRQHNPVKIAAMAKKLPPDVLEWFRQQGVKGGKAGGKRSLVTMTPAERIARATKASKAAAAARSAKAKAKKAKG